MMVVSLISYNLCTITNVSKQYLKFSNFLDYLYSNILVHVNNKQYDQVHSNGGMPVVAVDRNQVCSCVASFYI